MADSDPLLDALRRLTARPDAEFRHDQREAIVALVNDRSRVLVVQRTGWGKSAVYFLTTHLLRQQGLGPTLLISPLLALMRNQIEAATRLGLRCMTVNSADNTTVHELADALRDDAVDLLVISPERLANPDFANKVMPLVGGRPGLIVIDEVHCISDWGHDFRPDYRRIGRMVDRLAGTQVPILGCTATANDRVVHDVAVQLGAELTTFRGPLRRDGLALAAVPVDRQAERLAWLAETVPSLEGSGIVYCLTVRDVQNVAEWLRSQGIAADGYWGGLDNDDRLAAEQRLKSNETKVLVATTALGMGYDKPDLSFVVHFQSPGSPVAYYQQVGRAGRALERSVGVLLRGLEDEEIQDYFIERAFAQEHLIRDVVAVFERAGEPLSLIRVQTELNVKIGVLELVVKQLDVDGALTRIGPTTYQRSDESWDYPAARIDAVTNARRAEQQSMRDYFATADCRMQYVARLLDDPSTDACGICDNCTGAGVAGPPIDGLAVELVAEAERFLRDRPIVIEPRKMRFESSTGGRKKIPDNERIEEGRALSVWADGGWGRLVREGRTGTGAYDARLVEALAAMVERWQPGPAPAWVTSVPSLRRPALVRAMAEAVAERLGLPYVDVLGKPDERAPQVEQQNAAHQQRNVEGAFTVTGQPPGGPVLLIDDLISSGWTLAEVGRVLRKAGVPAVVPATLASSTGRD
jgi:ATP-dependent DNA helicase RecQ